jgi:DnaJ family protein A protein 5
MEKGIFKGYKKSDEDFYTVFSTLFAKLDEEEEMEEQVGKYHKQAPPFGDADSSKKDVYDFYNWWEGSTTLKPFAYVDEYDPRQAPNRRIKRLIEADNNKARSREKTLYL